MKLKEGRKAGKGKNGKDENTRITSELKTTLLHIIEVNSSSSGKLLTCWRRKEEGVKEGTSERRNERRNEQRTPRKEGRQGRKNAKEGRKEVKGGRKSRKEGRKSREEECQGRKEGGMEGRKEGWKEVKGERTSRKEGSQGMKEIKEGRKEGQAVDLGNVHDKVPFPLDLFGADDADLGPVHIDICVDACLPSFAAANSPLLQPYFTFYCLGSKGGGQNKTKVRRWGRGRCTTISCG
jgi:hypothetical protein